MRSDTLLPLVFQRIVWVPFRLCLNFFGRLEVRGIENLRNLTPNVIFAPNHTSEIDPALIPAALPFWSGFFPVIGASREKQFYKGLGLHSLLYGSWFFRLTGGFPVYSGLHDYANSVPHHIRLAKAGATFCIFPEGSKTKDGSIQRAKGGLTYIAESANCLIIPVAITGVYKMTMMDFFLRRRKIVVHFGLPIDQKEIRAHVPHVFEGDISIYKSEANYVMYKVKELLQKSV